MIRIKIHPALIRLRKQFIQDVERIVSGQPLQTQWHPLTLAILAGTPRQRRAEIRIKKIRKCPEAQLLSNVKAGDVNVDD